MAFTITRQFNIAIANNLFTDVENILTYDDEPIFQLKRHEDGYLGIYFDLYNEQGEKIAVIRRNELYFHKDTDRAKYEMAGTQNALAMQEKATKRMLYLVMKRQAAAPAELVVNLETYLPNGVLLKATPSGLNLPNLTFANMHFQNLWSAISVYSDGTWTIAAKGPRTR